ncbi:MAG: PCMD domain-containing protein [Bacteroidales bacterium]|nr:PCMD domain-containing protein [Bacteroidales bacterium]
MEKIQIVLSLLLLVLPARAQRYEAVPFGDFEQWVVRHIRESAILGGNVRTLYVVGPEEIIDKNQAYDYSQTIWASSNAYARVMGLTKTSVTVEPDQGPTGRCARLSTRFASCKVAGLVEIKVLATGALYWGKMLEPITGVKDPYSFMDWGIPYTGRPSALVLDCKAELPNTGILTKGTTFQQKEFPGKDPCQISIILQQRWEDAQGRIHALRVGTAVLRIHESMDWQSLRIPLVYGDASQAPSYGDGWELLQGEKALYALNSQGKSTPILEEGWAEADAVPTHALLQIVAGCQGAFTGALDNTLWVDNINLEYPE